MSLAKPILRAEFENDLKLICDGLKNPEEVRAEQIAKYRAVFQTVVDKMRLIDDSLANRLDDVPQAFNSELNDNQDDHRPALKCPKCGSDMILRYKQNIFLFPYFCSFHFILGAEKMVRESFCRVLISQIVKMQPGFLPQWKTWKY